MTATSDTDGTAAGRAGHTPAEVIGRIARTAQAIGFQAGVGGMETAGSIVSFLVNRPDLIPAFMETGSVIDWPSRWIIEGCLSWQGMDGQIHAASESMQAEGRA